MTTRSHKSSKSDAGSTLPILMLVLSAAVIVCYVLYSMIIQLNSLNRDNTSQIIYQTAMTSLLKYTNAAIKQQWCMAPDWTQLPASNCTLNSPTNTERMILSPDEISHINSMVQQGLISAPNPPTLSQIQMTVDVTKLPATHPIRQIVSSTEFQFLESIQFTILPDTGCQKFGSESCLKLQVQFFPKPDHSMPDGRQIMLGWSKIIVYPREVGTFALIVPGNLHLDGTSASLNGDVAFPSGTANEPGIIFDSPVFVNGNILIPPATTTQYTPISFTSQVILGTGILLQNGQPAQTTTAGGLGTLPTYSNMSGFGGFLAGISLDGQTDQGLVEFSNGASTNSMAVYHKCLTRNTLYTVPAQTQSAQIIAMSTGANSMNLSWSQEDYFSVQRFSPVVPNIAVQNLPAGVPQPTLTIGKQDSVMFGKTDGPIMAITATFPGATGNNGSAISGTVLMPNNSQATFYLPAPPPTPPSTTPGPPIAITITTKPVVGSDGYPQDNTVGFTANVQNAPAGTSVPFNFQVTGFDMSYQVGSGPNFLPTSVRQPMPSTFNNEISLQGNANGAKVTLNSPGLSGSSWSDAHGDTVAAESDQTSWEDLVLQCQTSSKSVNAFASASWDTEFDMMTSWNLFNPNLSPYPNPVATQPIYDCVNGVAPGSGVGSPESCKINDTSPPGNGQPNASFHVWSVPNVCEVLASSNFVSGFFICEQFVIDSRNTPLRIIGTVVTNKLTISSSAYRAGIRWSNIYNTNSVNDLRTAGVLKIAPGSPPSDTCNVDPNYPIWWIDNLMSTLVNPTPQVMTTVTNMSNDLITCSANFLRSMFDPIQWTTIDPDCGPNNPKNPGSMSPTCKNHPVRFTIVQYDWGYSW